MLHLMRHDDAEPRPGHVIRQAGPGVHPRYVRRRRGHESRRARQARAAHVSAALHGGQCVLLVDLAESDGAGTGTPTTTARRTRCGSCMPCRDVGSATAPPSSLKNAPTAFGKLSLGDRVEARPRRTTRADRPAAAPAEEDAPSRPRAGRLEGRLGECGRRFPSRRPQRRSWTFRGKPAGLRCGSRCGRKPIPRIILDLCGLPGSSPQHFRGSDHPISKVFLSLVSILREYPRPPRKAGQWLWLPDVSARCDQSAYLPR